MAARWPPNGRHSKVSPASANVSRRARNLGTLQSSKPKFQLRPNGSQRDIIMADYLSSNSRPKLRPRRTKAPLPKARAFVSKFLPRPLRRSNRQTHKTVGQTVGHSAPFGGGGDQFGPRAALKRPAAIIMMDRYCRYWNPLLLLSPLAGCWLLVRANLAEPNRRELDTLEPQR